MHWSTGQNPDIEKLNILEAEYQKLGIALSANKEFDLIKELRLARNSCIHNLNKPDDEYTRNYQNPRWLDDTGHISVTKSQWNELVIQLEQWTNELVRQISRQKQATRAREKG